tara:strand:+ start:1052 stop:1291 length:240 start_codon:yes stop_codon:yes gene_type:complete
MSKMFLIFYYVLNGQEYVEAYPVHDISVPYESLLPNDCPHAFMVCSSRNQARKEAYKLWVDSSGRGFNKMPHPRSYALK